MATGTLKWFDAEKGYGFIVPDDGGKDIFLHISAVIRAGISKLIEGNPINYELATDKRTSRPFAHDISLPATTN